MILNEISVVRHQNNTYCKANKSCDQIIDENTEYTKRLGFKNTGKQKKDYRSCNGFLKCRRIQQVHVSSLHLKYAPQNKFLNLFSMS